MQVKTLKSVFLLLAMVCVLCFPVQVSAETQQGTDGDELQVLEAEQLEIQLGADWAGVEFELKTDAGMYPGDVVVGEDGILRLEIGGSKSYILTCMNSSVQVPDPEQAPATEEASENDSAGTTQTEESTAAGIPTMHLILFGGGMAIAIGTLIGLYVIKRCKQLNPQYQDDDEEED